MAFAFASFAKGVSCGSLQSSARTCTKSWSRSSIASGFSSACRPAFCCVCVSLGVCVLGGRGTYDELYGVACGEVVSEERLGFLDEDGELGVCRDVRGGGASGRRGWLRRDLVVVLAIASVGQASLRKLQRIRKRLVTRMISARPQTFARYLPGNWRLCRACWLKLRS